MEIRKSALESLIPEICVLDRRELCGGDENGFLSSSSGDHILMNINIQSYQAVHIRFVQILLYVNHGSIRCC